MRGRTHDNVTRAVRSQLARTGENQRDLAEVLELSQPAVSHRFTGAVGWSVDEVDVMALHFGIGVCDLVMPRFVGEVPEACPRELER